MNKPVRRLKIEFRPDAFQDLWILEVLKPLKFSVMYKNYQKISKSKARKLFEAGKEIYLHTSLLSWDNPWQNPMPINFDPEDEKNRREFHERWPNDIWTKEPKKYISQFDCIVNSFHYYNCDKERGMRVIFLVEALPTSAY